MKQQKFKATVRVAGVKNRCRKAEYHVFNLGSFDIEKPNFHMIGLIAKDEIKKNMKTISQPKARVMMRFVEVENNTESFLMFDERNIEFDIEVSK